MKNLLLKCLLTFSSLALPYLIYSGNARADEWGCKVILCLSNPGGPTQFAQCNPPIKKLWRELAKGHSFPTCSGAGFRSSRPGYEPYYCDAGYRLSRSDGLSGRQATCISTDLQNVSRSLCDFDRDNRGSQSSSVLTPRLERQDGQLQCMGYSVTRPIKRKQPHYIDVFIDGASKQRIWY